MKARLPKGMGGGPSNMQGMIKQAQKMQQDMARVQEELEKRGIRSELLREEPFTTAQDSIEFKVHLMIWEKGILNRKARVETWEDK